MSKRKESDSGLRAGFIHEDEALVAAREQALKQEAADALEEKKEPEKEGQVKKEQAEPKAKKKKAKPAGPTVSMQGVSGKVITGVVKVIKKVPKEEETKEAEKAKVDKPETPKTDKPAAETAAKDLPEKVAKPAAEKPAAKKAETAKPEPAKVAEKPAEAEPAKAEPAKTEPKKEKVVEAKKAEPTKAETVPEKTEKPAATAKKAPVRQEAPKSEAPQKAAPKKEPAKAPEKKATEQKPAEKKPAEKKPPVGSKQRPLVDRGVTESRFADRPRIRPQKGNYVGKDTDTPAVERRGGRSGNRFGGRDRRDGGGKFRGGRQQRDFGGYDKDKDEDEKPRQSRSPRRDRRHAAPVPADMNDRKTDSRKQYSQRNQHDRNKRDYELRRQQDEFRAAENLRRNRRKEKAAKPAAQRAVLTNVKLPESLTVKELAEALKKTTAEVITKLMAYGVMATVNQELDYDTAEVIANEFGIKAEKLVEITEEDILFDDSEDKEEDLVPRPPVVVVMGHVDHGKTSILDYIRKASVASGEAGGITQHIGAYTVDVNGKPITFLDTPGHEAFTTMRARGAQVTDIAILVVAADDGVMPQTVEAINHARAADTEIIVAINKIDKGGINLDRVKQELAQYNLLSEEWGGTTTMVPVSAKTGENMDELLEMITLTAEVMELKANPERQAKGTVIESKLDRGRGPVATVLVQRGTLRTGDTIVVGSIIGHIRAMTNDKGQDVTEAGPSMPVEILGLSEVPEGGDIFYAVEDEKVARQLAEKRRVEEREQQLSQSSRMSLDNLFAQLEKGEVKDLNIIVKADVQGSVEAVKQSLEKLSNDEVRVQVIHGAVGAVTESDIRLAEVSNAVVIGFNVRPASNVAELAEENNVDIRLYRVIYDAIEDMEKALKGMLAPTFKEQVLGHAEVRDTFRVSGVGTVAGCYVTDGKIMRSSEVRVVRDGIVVHEGKLASLRRFKDDVREVASGYECGIGIERFNDIKLGDVIEAFEMKEIKPE